jgi:hypothetical protein
MPALHNVLLQSALAFARSAHRRLAERDLPDASHGSRPEGPGVSTDPAPAATRHWERIYPPWRRLCAVRRRLAERDLPDASHGSRPEGPGVSTDPAPAATRHWEHRLCAARILLLLRAADYRRCARTLRRRIRFFLKLCPIRRSTHNPRGVSEPPAKADG